MLPLSLSGFILELELWVSPKIRAEKSIFINFEIIGTTQNTK